MRKIEKILTVEKRDKAGAPFYITTAICGGDEVTGYSLAKEEFQVGQEVMVGFDDRWHTAKMWRELPKKDLT